MLKIGLLGCGRISEKHFEAVVTNPNAKIIACCDINEQRARDAAQKYHIPLWTPHYEDMLQIDDIDLISICTPSGLHPEHGMLAAHYDKHILTEKPMAVCLPDADELIKTCSKAGVQLFVVLQNRLNPAVQLLRRAFLEGRFGKLFMIIANVFWYRPQEYYDMAPWRGTWALDGGAFMNQASHYVDIVQWFGGPVASVIAHTNTLARNIETEDSGSAIVNFKNGIIGSINVTMLTYPENLEGSITIIGETGTVKVGGIAMNRIEYWKFDDHCDYDLTINRFSSSPDSVYGFGHTDYYSHIISSLTANCDSPADSSAFTAVDGFEGRKSLQLLEDIYKYSNKISR